MLRIAITAAGLVLATGAMADGFNCENGSCWQISTIPTNGIGTSTAPIPALPPSHCLPGWTLVNVASRVLAAPAIHKCAAVGDLRDPE